MRNVAVCMVVLLMAWSASPAQKKAELKTQKQKASYGIGMNIGKEFKEQFPEVDVEAMVRGFRDALAGTKMAIPQAELDSVMMAFQQDMMQRSSERMATLGAKNLKEGEAYCSENKEKPGVITLPSGLQYRIIKEGTGPKPTPKDTVVCNYRGTLVNGKEFDSSYKHGQPAEFVLGQVIPGWIEALQMMPVGSKWELVVPANLAYGERARSADIGPNSTLLFEIELLGIK
ncbi:MAG TPA: FKBP-type peptidyl-prolyl cis-trans isomerase [Bacteroidota bacterium]|nr:FKBP-type peptidyl-prolyl cis-trans isomerase [Bacteroidota bacterium]